jgi:membrane protease YdiL (CAAX protease family)
VEKVAKEEVTMRTVVALIKRYPLSAFFVLAYALSWWVYPLIQVSPIVGFMGLFGPALAAIIVVAAAEGKTALRDLLGRILRWRVGVRWYVIALGLPAVLALVTAGVHLLLGAPTPVALGQLSILEPILFVLVVGEEIGWRGYALPRLLATRSMLSASLILGVLWGAWHLPTFFIPGLPQHSIPFSAFMLLTIAYSVLFTWIYVHTAGSVLIATLFHGSINFCQGFFLGGIDPAREYWLLAIVWWVAALVVVFGTGTTFVRKPASTP